MRIQPVRLAYHVPSARQGVQAAIPSLRAAGQDHRLHPLQLHRHPRRLPGTRHRPAVLGSDLLSHAIRTAEHAHKESVRLSALDDATSGDGCAR